MVAVFIARSIIVMKRASCVDERYIKEPVYAVRFQHGVAAGLGEHSCRGVYLQPTDGVITCVFAILNEFRLHFRAHPKIGRIRKDRYLFERLARVIGIGGRSDIRRSASLKESERNRARTAQGKY